MHYYKYTKNIITQHDDKITKTHHIHKEHDMTGRQKP